MLESDLKTQLQAYLQKVTRPIEIVASLDDSPKSREMEELLGEIVLLSDKITLVERRDADAHTPS
ncbi:MAG: alkyl hydroperoxide reductase subunit F, partial [Pseudoxanthomonas sp.]